MRIRLQWLIVGTVLGGLLASGVALAATRPSSKAKAKAIHACYARKGGKLRIAKVCRKSEKKISWNQKGPAGPTGKAGPQSPGSQGSDGPAGSQGPAGPAGALGPDGVAGALGPAGHDGVAGADGAVGPQGPDGPAGARGAAGSDGVPGADGADGAQGPVGPSGPSGVAVPLSGQLHVGDSAVPIGSGAGLTFTASCATESGGTTLHVFAAVDSGTARVSGAIVNFGFLDQRDVSGPTPTEVLTSGGAPLDALALGSDATTPVTVTVVRNDGTSYQGVLPVTLDATGFSDADCFVGGALMG